MPYRKEGSQNWYITWTDGGIQRTRSSRTTDYTEAKRLENALRSRQQYQPVAETKSIEAVLGALLKARPTEKNGFSAKPLLLHFGGLMIEEITPDKITLYKQSRGVSDSTLNKELGLLRTAIRYCNQEMGWNLPEVTKGRIPRENKGRIRWITKDEGVRLIESVTKRAPYLQDFIVLALNTGMRKGELLSLTWQRVDLFNRVIHFDPKDHKSRTYAAVPLNNTAHSLLTALLKGAKGDYVIHRNSGEPVGDIRKGFRLACERAGIDNFTPHDLRHTCASWLAQAGVPIITIKEIMRHSDITTTMRYAHLAPKDLAAGVGMQDTAVKLPYSSARTCPNTA